MSEPSGLEIAIIGMTGRFPKAADIDQLWRNLRAGMEGVSFFSDEELAAAGIPAVRIADPNYVKAAAILDGIELFDAPFFDISAREAEILDPQHRLLLECGWEALERAGHAGTHRAVGVFAGAGQNSYLFNHLIPNPELLASQGLMAISLASEKDFLATRLSYKLGLEGPSVTVQTACSTSLMAVHLACQSLLAGECELALAGGISVGTPQKAGHLYQPGSLNSPDGHCRTFDASARGTVSGQGVGLVVLRLLEDAIAGGDHIHAIIKGSASNNDGSLRAGFTAPSRDGQARVITAAQMRAEVEAGSISYIEAHGTATPLGDPIEVAALTKAFRETTDRRGFCALGSVKTNIGHLDAAAGVTGLIKTALALEHQEIPPSLHFETPNPEIDFASSPFHVVTRLTPWIGGDSPRRAGVSSFGLGGTNVHVILEEPPPPPPPGPTRAGQILILSTRSAEGLERATDNLAAWLESHPGESLGDVAHTLQVGRVPFRHRRALVAADRSEAAALGSRDPRRVWSAEVEAGDRPVAFLLSGVGDHYLGMAQGLYRTEEVFREELDRCGELLRPHLGLDLRELLFAGTKKAPGQGIDLRALLGRGAQAELGPLHETRIAQPAVMAVSWALAQLWISWGVRPQALLGYSLGEYTAACLAGVMSLEDGLTLVAHRAQLIAGLPPGAMLAVPLSEADLLPRLKPGLSLAAENGPSMSVVSGAVESVDELERQLTDEGLSCRRLPTTHAFHSSMMEPLRERLAGMVAEMVAGLRLAPPSIPYVSNVTGTWITAGEATDPHYWASHLCQPVRFGRALETLWAQPRRVLLEVGPGQGLSTLALQHPAQRGGMALASLRHAQERQPDELFLLGTLARLWLAGVPVDWEGFSAGEARRRVPLPTYPFERRRYWIDAPRRDGKPAASRQAPVTAEEDRTAEAAPTPYLPARHERPRLLNPYVPPATSEQQRLAGLWQELLGVAPVGLYDNFFELGGHSLLGTQMMARLRSAFGVDLPLSALFESPTVADMARALGTPAKSVERPPLRPRPAGFSELPLSFAQQRLWFLDQLEPENAFYNISNTHRLTGPFSAPLARTALREIIRRHESLRTVFPAVNGTPSQVILPRLEIDIPVEDLSVLPEPLRHGQALRRAREEGRRIFDLARGPLLRVRLLRLGEEDHILLLIMHHIISDGWSFQVLLGELVTLYAAFAAGRPTPLPELSVQYADYSLWQRRWFEDGALAEQLSWWRDHLTGAPPALEMPTDRPHPQTQTFEGATRTLSLPPEPSAALSRTAHAAGASLFMALIAVFNTLLHHLSGQNGIVVGTPIANRVQEETEGLIGVFVNTLALHTNLSGDPSFHELLARVRRATLGAYDHQDLPFDRVVEELQPQRTLSRPPLFQVLFQLLNQPVRVEAPGSFRASPFEAETGVAMFDLMLSIIASESWLIGSLQFNTGLFDTTTVDRLAGHFLNLIAAVAVAPERPISELPFLSVAERHQLLTEWNDSLTPLPAACPHEWIEAQADLSPDAIAVISGEERLAYRELDRRANGLAHRLRALQIGPEVPVGLCARRSLDWAVGVLGILKAGGVYVPLDPDIPRERFSRLVEGSGISVLLTQSPLADALPTGDVQVLLLHEVTESRDRLATATGPENLSYIIYTSGSTGVPKGAMIEHRGMLNHLRAKITTLGLTAADLVAQTASPSFDISVWQLLAPLLSGAQVHVLPDEVAHDPRRLLADVDRLGITVLESVPSLLRLMLDEIPEQEGERPHLPSLRWLIPTGEALPPLLCRRWLAFYPGIPLVNAYGPTECSDDVTHSIIPLSPGESQASMPIGRPVPNLRLYVLGKEMQPLPARVPGELFVAGAGVGRGYLREGGKTAATWVPDPFSEVPGGRLYRTGDSALLLPDGRIEFLGRLDHQVKVRGHRIELGEIETALAAHPAVRQAVVLAREDASGHRRLVAYVLPAPETEPSAAELRRVLAERLPDTMIPTAFTVLSSFPLTPNGKLDRKALPAPDQTRAPQPGLGDDAPRTSAEQVLSRIWAQVLRLDRVGVYDNFFELGGDSILSIQVVTRASQAGLRLTPRQLFQHQTIAELAAVADTAPTALADQGAVVGELPLTPIQRWFFAQHFLHPERWNQSVLLAVHEPIVPPLLERAFGMLLEHHDALRLRFLPGQPMPRQLNAAPGGETPFNVFDLSALPATKRSAAVAAAADSAQDGFDLEQGPIARTAFFDLGPDMTGRLLVAVHHLAIDGVSWRILLEDLALAYRALARGEEPDLPPKTLSFQDWAMRLAEHSRSAALAAEREYWLAEPRRQAAPLPVDRPGGANTEASARSVTLALGAEETRALLQDVPRACRTQVNDALLTALARTITGWTGERRMLLDLEAHGREEPFGEADVDLSRTIGWLTSEYPLLLELGDTGDFGEDVRTVKEQIRAVPSRGGLGYGLLRYSGEEETAGRLAALPPAELIFNYLGQIDQSQTGGTLLGPAPEPSPAGQSRSERRAHLLEVTAVVTGGRLTVSWMYSRHLHRQETMEALADSFLGHIRDLIAYSRSAIERRVALYTPADFPLAGINRREMDRLVGSEWGIEDIYPLSPLQEGILFHSLFEPGSGAYIEQLLAHLGGEIDADALEAACRSLVERHSILRTSFHALDRERPLQVVHGAVEVALEQEDWSDLPRDEENRRLADLLREDRERDFDPARAPLMRWKLLKTGDREHRLLWSHHHVLLDGWSCSALSAELLALYEAHRQGTEPALPRRRPFRDYIAWLGSQDLHLAEEYWRRALAGWREPTPLGLGSSAGQRGWELCQTRLTTAETEALQARARRSRVTLNTLVQAAWGLLLGRYSGRDEVVFGTTVAGRPSGLSGAELMVGLFINTLPVRLRTGDGELGPWLGQLQAEQAELRQFEHSPLVKIQEWSGVPHGTALFESILVFENYPLEASLQAGGSSSPLGVLEARAFEQTNYPLTVEALPGESLQLRVSFDRSRFEAVTMVRLLGHLSHLLLGLSTSPNGRSLTDLDPLSAAERHQVVLGWNDTAHPPWRELTLHGLFERQVERTPRAPAVLFEGRALTYAELEERANRLAAWLRRNGAGPEELVGVCLERSLDLVTSLLAILKTGAAYVPFDPDLPAERLAFLLADTGARTVLTTSTLALRLPAGAPVVLLDAAGERIADESSARPAVRVEPDSLAYTIYTSGSTGRPKGAMNTHRGIVNRLLWMQEQYGLTASDRVLQKTPFSFDVSVWEFFWPLQAGALLIMAQPGGHQDPSYLADTIAREAVTTLHFVPSMLRGFLDQDGIETRCGSLQRVFCSGEALPYELQERFFSRFSAELHNLYGPTEAAVEVTFHACSAKGAAAVVPIGRPIANLRVLVLDPKMQPLPAGATGELYLGGAGLARGYLKRPDLTAERFVPDPLGEPGQRLYRTGDLTRYMEDGAVEYLGRTDHQVKVRGQRIELGEIEAVLQTHPGVRNAAVVARSAGEGDLRLLAFIVPRQAEGTSPGELRAFTAERLPEAMVPSGWAFLERLPLTASGKVDRKALPEVETVFRQAGKGSPRTLLEEVLAGIFADALGLAQVGIHDSFFNLGGHSLLAVRAVAAVRRALGVELPVRQIFEALTVEALAGAVETRLRAQGGAAVAPPIERRPSGAEAPLSFAQQRLWFLDRLDPGSAAYNIPAAVRLGGSLAIPALAASLAEVARRHEILRTSFHEVKSRPVQRVAFTLGIPLPVADVSGLPEGLRQAELRRLAQAHNSRPFNLERLPLLHASLLRLAEDDHIALFAVHHIVADGWSMGVLVREIGILYRAFLEGKPSPLPVLPIQYADFATWQRRWLEGEALEERVEHWRRCMAGAPARLDLPGARPRPVALSPRGAARHRRFPASLLEQIRALGRREAATLFMTLVAPLKALLHARTGAADIVVGTDMAGRDRPETEGLIGFFINQIPLRTDLSGDPTLRELLGRVRETALSAYTHQDLPFDHLVEALRVKRTLQHSPVFQVKLVLQNAHQESLDLPGLALRQVALESETTQLDLHWSASEVGGELWLTLTYSTDLYDAPLIERLLDQYEAWLRAFAERPEERLEGVAAELARIERAQRTERELELKAAGLGKLRGLRRPAEEPAGRLQEAEV